ncbi:toxin co-regulated pilus biosynthesis Q family protein [Tatumella ptyseos]|uniref:Toxin co-regulated pilus biosynthesis protein Q C-terminal domain-containing protein n=2 Tax=Tatumella ptyseos TaxID=82987 RepID=A0A085JDD4_9GAMM|nr:toxin co-regulated pilus biosynthesis Q family protein [Tatumella ptyseos]KFD18480.1 hypothetical protein GTPT_2670 [Tatumella ptyseos ATCC 33301]SQK74263.1 Toxin co-regulated pilus biosynthesis protein Q [Tatumella ptyseos]
MARKILYCLVLLFVFSRQDLAAEGFLASRAGNSPENGLSQIYEISSGTTLKEGLQQWSATSGCNLAGIPHWKLIWESHVNYPVDAPLIFHGDYLSAIAKVIDLYSAAQIPLYAHIYRNQCLVVIDTR